MAHGYGKKMTLAKDNNTMNYTQSFKMIELKERNFQKRLAQTLEISLESFLKKEVIDKLNKFRNEKLQNNHKNIQEYFNIYDFHMYKYFSEIDQIKIYKHAFNKLVFYFKQLFNLNKTIFVLFYWEGKRVGISTSCEFFLTKIEFFENATGGITIISNSFQKIIEIYRREYKLELIISSGID